MQTSRTLTNASLSSRLDPTWIFGAVAFVAPLLTLYVPLSLAILLPLGAVMAVVCRIATGGPTLRPDRGVTILLAALIVTALASALWSYAPAVTLRALPRTVASVTLGVVFIAAMAGLEERQKRTISIWLVAGTAIAILMILVERLNGGVLMPFQDTAHDLNRFLNQFNRPLSVLSVLIWPVAVRVAQIRRGLGIALVAAFFLLLLVFNTTAAILATAGGAVVFLCVYAAPRVAGIAVGIVLAATVAFAPWIDLVAPPPKAMFETLHLPNSAYHRLLIWQFADSKIDERPILGWGYNTSRAMPGGKQIVGHQGAALPLHPHNAAMQWRLELGILGSLLGAALFLLASENARRYAAGRLERAGAMATVTAAFAVAMLSYGVWQSWWVSALFLCAGFAIVTCRGERPAPET